MPSWITLIGTGLSVLMSVVAITAVITQVRTNVAILAQREQSLTEKSSQTYKDLTDLLVLVKQFMAQQTVINTTVAATLDRVTTRLDATEAKATEASVIVQLFEELLKRVHERKLNIEP